ncbi:hypothetical protein [Pseudooceanicola spongiae]|uniref:Uncharacterized protein n=1 Tax=Pseudooceanicola spongiae TaxID=2613965 RepID=A0A7L9WJ98_9RHOB|nr:hypothetical protein [Pseudooceanicola spongiae]QOL80455.1 hypothetical protein F3W81_06295 [Pseudooceanicola spongiae]
MTNERVCANNAPMPAESVKAWQNESVHGLALCAEHIFKDHIQKAEDLRAQEASYRAGLPKTPDDALRSGLRVIHPEGEDYPEGVEEALHLSFALEAMLRKGELDEAGPSHDAALYVADRITLAMQLVVRQLDYLSDVLGSPGRVARDFP